MSERMKWAVSALIAVALIVLVLVGIVTKLIVWVIFGLFVLALGGLLTLLVYYILFGEDL